MTKGKRKATPGRKTRKGTVVAIPRGVQLDRAAANYAALLADPCNGPLTTGPFGDGGGGMISRFEADLLVNIQSTEVGAAFAFMPGKAFGFVTSTTVTSDVSPFVLQTITAASPGITFLSNNASQFRALSACLQVYYPGSELSRSGMVSVGQYPASMIGNSQTTAALRTAAQYVERTPEQYSEIVWRPNNFDLEWTSPNVTSIVNDSKYSCLAMSAAGLPLATGIRVRVVVVYEWLPLAVSTNGFVIPMNRGSLSTNSFQDVVRKLDEYGDWMYHGALAAGKAASSVYKGVRAIGQVAYGVKKMAPLLMA